MKVSYEEGLANHFGPRRRCDGGNDVVLSVRHGASVGQLWSSEITTSVCRLSLCQGKATPGRSNSGQIDRDTAESKNLCMRGHSLAREPGDPIGGPALCLVRSGNRPAGKPDMNADGKSDGLVVPSNRTNNAGAEPAEESAEGSEPTKKNASQADSPRVLKRNHGRSPGLTGVREVCWFSGNWTWSSGDLAFGR